MDVSQKGSNSWLSAVFAHIREGVIGVDMAGQVVWMNAAAERLTGKRQQQIKGQGVDVLFDSSHPPVADTLFMAMEQTAAHGPYPLFFSSDNRSLQVDCTIVPVPQGDESGGTVIVLSERGTGQDAGTAAVQAVPREASSEVARRVLVMDDDEVVRTLTVQKLIRLGYESEGASNGEEAVSKFKAAMGTRKAFDVVVLDLIVKGGMGGKETIEMLRSIDPDVKAVLTSGHAVDPVLTNFWEYGFLGVVRKPFVIKELEVVIREAIEEA